MANISRVWAPQSIIQGPADVYLDVAAPPSAIPPASGTNIWGPSGTYSIDANGQPADSGSAGVHLGIAEGPAVFTMTPKFLEVMADQLAAPVDAAFTQSEFEIDFSMKEVNLSNLALLLQPATYTNVTSGTNPAADFLQVGNLANCAVSFHTLMFVSPNQAAPSKYYVVMAYKAMLSSAFQTTFHRPTETTWKLKFKCLADTTRVLKDAVAQFVKFL